MKNPPDFILGPKDVGSSTELRYIQLMIMGVLKSHKFKKAIRRKYPGDKVLIDRRDAIYQVFRHE